MNKKSLVDAGNAESNRYNEDVFKNNIKFAILGQLASPPEGFEDVTKAHFYLKRLTLIKVSAQHHSFDYTGVTCQ